MFLPQRVWKIKQRVTYYVAQTVRILFMEVKYDREEIIKKKKMYNFITKLYVERCSNFKLIC